jgi:hypothetical protein
VRPDALPLLVRGAIGRARAQADLWPRCDLAATMAARSPDGSPVWMHCIGVLSRVRALVAQQREVERQAGERAQPGRRGF